MCCRTTARLLRKAAAAVCMLGLTLLTEAWGDRYNDALLKDIQKLLPAVSQIKFLSADLTSTRKSKMAEMWNGSVLLGYCVDLEAVSRSGPFRLLVAVSPEETILGLALPDYPHKRGRAVRRQGFLDQFKGAAYSKPLKLGDQVDGASGATSSANAVTAGVRQALIVVHRQQSRGK